MLCVIGICAMNPMMAAGTQIGHAAYRPMVWQRLFRRVGVEGERRHLDYGTVVPCLSSPSNKLQSRAPTTNRSSTSMSTRADALVDRADELEQCGQPQAACRAYQAALHLDPHCRAAAVNLGVLLKCVDRLPACRAAHRHAAALHAQLRLNEPQRLCDGGPTFGMGACAPSQLARAATVLRESLRAGDYGSRTARRLLRLHGGAEAEGEAPPVVGIAEGGAGHELCSTGLLLRLRSHPGLRDRLLRDAPQPAGVLLLLFLLGGAVRRAAVEGALGAATLATLREHGLLLPAGEDGPGGLGSSTQLLASPVQVYPVPTHRGAATIGGAEATTEAGTGDCREVGAGGGGGAGDGGGCGDEALLISEGELLVATDWARESLVPAKFAVMPIGDDSLNLVHLAPRRRCRRVLDLCTGSGVQVRVRVRVKG